MPDEECEMPAEVTATLSTGADVIIHAMNQGLANANSRAMEGHNNFMLQVEYQYLTSVQTMSGQQAMAYRTATESGSGQTRREINEPTT